MSDDQNLIYMGTTTVSGNEEHGYRVSPPKHLVVGQDLGGEILWVYLDDDDTIHMIPSD